uniref:hypothetical protein n=1 Tax=Micromonospora sp. NBC_00855 TaxID=2975978 RepID=UPI00224F0519|nr:hypothetical protein OHB51_35425 [Micromonospora sp. NBC_00855]
MTACQHPNAIAIVDTTGALVRRHCDECKAEPEPVTARQFQPRPGLVEAIQFDGTNALAIADWARGTTARVRCWPVGPQLWIDTLGRVDRADIGDWAIREHDEIRTVTAALFDLTHEPAE